MVYIKRVSLSGFKSFGPRKQTVRLDKGLTVLTGPNGGGKSNLFDAVRFALGELSPRSLRVGKFSELVHNPGGDGHGAPFARVSVCFHNPDRDIPLDSSEVTMSRKLMPSGESDYRVNGRSVSRTDMLNMLAAANIRSSGFNILPQGSVIAVAEMSPAEMRKMLDEISGVSEFERRRSEAEIQLAVAEKNLDVAKASTAEVRRRVRQLEIERNQYLRSQFIERELRQIRGMLVSKRLNEAEASVSSTAREEAQLRSKMTELSDRKRNLVDDKRKIDADVSSLEKELAALERERLRDMVAELEAARKQRVGMETEIRVLEAKKESLASDKEERHQLTSRLLKVAEESEARIGEIEISRARLTAERDDVRHSLETLADAYAAMAEEETSRRARATELQAKVAALNNKITQGTAEAEAAASRKKTLQQVVSSNRDEIKRLEERIQSTASLESEATSQDAEASGSVDDFQLQIEEERRKAEEITLHVNHAQDLLHEAEKLFAEANAAWETALLVHSRSLLLAKAQRLVDGGSIQGVQGRLSSFLEIPPDLRPAVESACSGWLQAVLLEDQAEGERLARLMSYLGANGRTIAANSIGPKSRKIPDQSIQSSLLLDSIGVTGKDASKAVQEILGDVYLVETVDEGSMVAEKGCRGVSRQGVMFLPGGRTEFPARATAEPEGLREEDLAALKKSVKMLRTLLEQKTKSRAETEKELSALLHLKSDLQERLSDLRQRLGVLHKEKLDLVQEKERILSTISSLEAEVSSTASTAEAKRSEVEALRSSLDALKAELEAESASPVEERVRQLRSQEAALSERLSQIESKISALDAEEKGIRQNVLRSKAQLEQWQEAADAAESGLRSADASIEEMRSSVQRQTELEKELERGRDEIERSSEHLRTRLDERRGAIREIDEQVSEIDQSLQDLSLQAQALSSRVAEQNIDVRLLRARLESLGFEQPIAVGDIDLGKVEKRATDLEKELSDLGSVNQLAPRQYEEIVRDYKVRAVRIAELEREREEILRFMEEIDRDKLETFMNFFTRVSSSFNSYFNRLTGGSARLELEDEADPLSSGVEMHLQFVGKPPRVSAAASGGEKSVAVIALLLALQGLTPASFYIFDEVDAHMDVRYSKNLAELLKENAHDTQIIVVSLKDILAEQADKLIGVYPKQTESHVVTTKL